MWFGNELIMGLLPSADKGICQAETEIETVRVSLHTIFIVSQFGLSRLSHLYKNASLP